MILNVKEPHEELGSKPKGQADFIRQNGIIFGWSESNVRYELAWWHYPGGNSPIKQNLIRTRPLPEGVKI